MFNPDERQNVVNLLGQVQATPVTLSARAKLSAGQDLNDAEKAVVDFVLAGVEYKGHAAQVLANMEAINSVRQKLMAGGGAGVVEAPEKKRDRHKAPSQPPPNSKERNSGEEKKVAE